MAGPDLKADKTSAKTSATGLLEAAGNTSKARSKGNWEQGDSTKGRALENQEPTEEASLPRG